MTQPGAPSAKSPRALEIDQLVYFIRTADVHSARRAITSLLNRGEQISREILSAYHKLETHP
jgi:hypothetical protein